MATLKSGDTAPYAPPGTVIDVLTRYRERGMPTPFTVEVLERAGIPETLSRRTLTSLKLLGFIDSEGNPTAEFDQASRASDSDYKDALSQIVMKTYSEVITFADPASDSYDRVRDAFRAFNPRGQLERQVTLYLGLMEFVGLDVSAAMSSRKKTDAAARPSGGQRGAKKTAAAVRKAAPSKAPASPAQAVEVAEDDLPPGLVGLLRQIPRGGSGWPVARRDEFIAAFTAVLNFSIPVREHEPAPPAGGEEELAP
jgi:hypothetical protein